MTDARDASCWRALTETLIDEYLEDYEMRGEDGEGRDGCYCPSESERALIKDAVMGFLAQVYMDFGMAPARGIDSPEGGETRSGSTAKPQEPGREAARPETGSGVEVPPPLPAGEAVDIRTYPREAKMGEGQLLRLASLDHATPATAEAPPLPASEAYVEVWEEGRSQLKSANKPYFTADQMRQQWKDGYAAGLAAQPSPSLPAEREGLVDVLRAERDHARARLDRAVTILTGIHALLDPEPVQADGKTWVFKNPHAQEALRELSKRIRAIPDEIAALTPTTPAAAQPAQQEEKLAQAARDVLAEWNRLYPNTKYQDDQLDAWEDFEFRQMNSLRSALKDRASTRHQQDGGKA